jgi:VanZ family protein
MAVIFYLSSQPAVDSKALSDGATEVVEKILAPIEKVSSINFDQVIMNIRKYAHFFAYFLLGLFLILTFKAFDLKKSYQLTVLIGFFYAVSDEFHQKFIPGRSGEIRDIFIDLIGILTAVGLVRLTTKIRKVK